MVKDKKFSNNRMTRRGFLQRIGSFISSHWLLTSVTATGAGIFTWAEYDTHSLKIESWDLFYPNLPPKLDGKRIVQLSDLHLETLQIPAKKIINSVNTLKPDLLVITGDLISTRKDLDKLSMFLSPLEAHFGRYVVMGNNDHAHLSRTMFKQFLDLLKSMGWQPLLNDSDFIKDLDLWVIGVDDPATAHDDVPKAYAKLKTTSNTENKTSKTLVNPFNLVLSHSTDCINDLYIYGADLFLTGHTHGGQIRLPGVKPFVTNTYLADKGIYEGYHIIGGIPLYINRGIGGSGISLRWNVPPEIAVFTLNKGSEAARKKT